MRKTRTLSDVLWLTLTALLVLWAQVNGYLVLTLGAAGVALVLGTALLPLSEDAIRCKANRIREALRLADISPTKAALYIYGSEKRLPEFLHALNCDRALDTWKLERLPAEFHRLYAVLELRDRGLPRMARMFLKLADVMEERETA